MSADGGAASPPADRSTSGAASPGAGGTPDPAAGGAGGTPDPEAAARFADDVEHFVGDLSDEVSVLEHIAGVGPRPTAVAASATSAPDPATSAPDPAPAAEPDAPAAEPDAPAAEPQAPGQASRDERSMSLLMRMIGSPRGVGTIVVLLLIVIAALAGLIVLRPGGGGQAAGPAGAAPAQPGPANPAPGQPAPDNPGPAQPGGPGGDAAGAIPAACLIPADQFEVSLENGEWKVLPDQTIGSYELDGRNLADRQVGAFLHFVSQNSRITSDSRPSNAWSPATQWFGEAGEKQGQDAHPLASADFWQGEYATDCYFDYADKVVVTSYGSCSDSVSKQLRALPPGQRGTLLDAYARELPVLGRAQGFACHE